MIVVSFEFGSRSREGEHLDGVVGPSRVNETVQKEMNADVLPTQLTAPRLVEPGAVVLGRSHVQERPATELDPGRGIVNLHRAPKLLLMVRCAPVW